MDSARSVLALLSGVLLAAALAGCNSTGPQTASAPALASPAVSGCAGEIGRFQAVLDNDLATGHVNQTVHTRASADLGRASTAYSAGRDDEAARLVVATKARYGY